MKNAKKEMTLREAVAYDTAQALGKYTLLGLPFTRPITPIVIKDKFVDGFNKLFESNRQKSDI